MIDILVGIVKTIVSMLSAVVEAVASMIGLGGGSASAGELIVIAVVFILELLLWAVLWVFELVMSLFRWQRPKKIHKPTIWRPKRLTKNNDDRD